MKNILYTLALLVSFSSFGQTTEDYFVSGYEKAEAKDYNGAVSDYTKAIELNPNDAEAYSNRGEAKNLLGDLNGACADWKKAAELGDTEAAGWVSDECN